MTPLVMISLAVNLARSVPLATARQAMSRSVIMPTLALIFVAAAAAGGLLLLFPMRLSGRRAPNFLIYVHGSAAIAGVACLVVYFL